MEYIVRVAGALIGVLLTTGAVEAAAGHRSREAQIVVAEGPTGYRKHVTHCLKGRVWLERPDGTRQPAKGASLYFAVDQESFDRGRLIYAGIDTGRRGRYFGSVGALAELVIRDGVQYLPSVLDDAVFVFVLRGCRSEPFKSQRRSPEHKSIVATMRCAGASSRAGRRR